MSDRLFRIMERHQLDCLIVSSRWNRFFDALELLRLKKLKLTLKDRIARLTRSHALSC